METDPVVQLVDVVAVLDRFPALAGVTLTVRRSEIVLLTGANGAGKTTLLRLCAGLVPPARGAATVLGLDLAEHRQIVRSRVGLLGHSNGLYTDLSVTENVEFWGATVAASNDEVAASLDRGVFGVPTLFVGERSFWGNDRLHFVEAELRKR